MTFAGFRSQSVRGSQTVGDLHTTGEQQLRIRRPLCDDLIQALAGDVLHHDISFGLIPFGLTYLIDSADVRVIDGRGQAGLAQLGGAHLLRCLLPALEQLQNHRALQQRVVGQKHNAAPARADLAHELILLNHTALHTLIISVRAGCPCGKGYRGVAPSLHLRREEGVVF